MKKQLKSYISFTRSERVGTTVLCAMLIMLICIRAGMFLFIHPVTDNEKQERIKAWDKLRQNSIEIKAGTTGKNNFIYGNKFNHHHLSDSEMIDINSADSETLVSLRGIGPATASRIIGRRKTIGPFTDINQLLEIPHFPKTYFHIIKQHLIIGHNTK